MYKEGKREGEGRENHGVIRSYKEGHGEGGRRKGRRQRMRKFVKEGEKAGND